MNGGAGGVKDQSFFGCECVEISSFVFEFSENLNCAAIRGAFEQQMFKAMGHS
jgi:hypothetical protein